MKILILAQNPKTRKNLKNPLRGTKSWDVVETWLSEAQVPQDCLEIRNAYQAVGSSKLRTNARLAEKRWLGEVIEFPIIVCLGRAAEEAVRFTRESYFPSVTEWDHFFLPHPSGLNRVLNDPEAHAEAVKQLRAAYRKLLTLRSYDGRIKR